MRLELRLAPLPTAPARARRALADWMGARARTKDGQAALVVVDELVMNGVVHDGGDDIVVRAEDGDGAVTIEVVTTPRAAGPPPFPRPNAEPDEVGRGMAVVAALCRDVNVHNDGFGRRIVCCWLTLG
jgi:histidine kinase-like protein